MRCSEFDVSRQGVKRRKYLFFLTIHLSYLHVYFVIFDHLTA